MSKKYTPGPWIVDGIAVGQPDGDGGLNLVATVYQAVADESGNEANARLIAAAPTMADALDEAETAFVVINICDDLTPQARKALRVAWAAVSAAKSAALGIPDHFAEANA